jgi:hypothetical protein
MLVRPLSRFTCVVLLLAGLAGAQTYKNARAGFALSPPEKFNPVPVALQDKNTDAKWVSKNAIRDLSAELLVMSFAKVSKNRAVESPNEAGSRPSYDDDNPFDLTSYQKYCKLAHEGFKLDKPREIKVKGTTVKARVFEHNVEPIGQRGAQVINAWYGVAIIDTPDRQYAIEMKAIEAAKEKLLPAFLDVVRSFKVLDPSEIEEAEDEAKVAGLSEKDKARRTAELTKRQVPGWWFKETPNYIILTDVRQDRAEIIDLVKARLEKLRKTYERDFPPSKPIEAVSIVRICANEKGYYDYGGPRGSAGYWYAFAQELVLYAGGAKGKTLAVLNHEAFHQYIYYAVGEISPHDWYNEGHGDYYSGGEPEGKDMRIKPFDWRTGTIKNAISTKKHIPIPDFLKYTHAQYYGPQIDLCYAQGWSLIYFLRKGLPEKHPWRSILPTYFDTLCASKDAGKALDAAWKGVDLAAFEQAWAGFIMKDTLAPMPKN